MTTFYIIRHGKHDYTQVEERKFIGMGLELSPLVELGKEQALQCCKDIRLQDCDIILSSPYTRAMQTASIISRDLNLDLNVEIDLRERDLDTTFQVKNFTELKQLMQTEEKAEPLSSVKERAINVLKKYEYYKKVIVVTHGYIIHSLMGVVGIPNCSIYEYHLE